jgi:hypothetical protein
MPEEIPTPPEAQVPEAQPVFEGVEPLLQNEPAATLPPSPDSEPPAPARTHRLLAVIVAIIGWTLPGGGHLLLRRWARALVAFCAVAVLVFAGYKMRGNIFPPHGADAFDFLGFLADAGAGIFYPLAKAAQTAGPDVSRAAGDYGTRLLATAGVLNVLILLDAVQIALGEKD